MFVIVFFLVLKQLENRRFSFRVELQFNHRETCSTFLRRDRFIASANSDINESVSNFRVSLMLPRSLQKRFLCTLESGKIVGIFYRIAI